LYQTKFSPGLEEALIALREIKAAAAAQGIDFGGHEADGDDFLSVVWIDAVVPFVMRWMRTIDPSASVEWDAAKVTIEVDSRLLGNLFFVENDHGDQFVIATYINGELRGRRGFASDVDSDEILGELGTQLAVRFDSVLQSGGIDTKSLSEDIRDTLMHGHNQRVFAVTN
jgi:hypothetical protein